jgi:3-hydroxyisobutyrate dehydrogenase-like beta-hydroxyacid dehydrogenase
MDSFGFIGLGRMGIPMARRLMEAGHGLVVYDVQPEPVRQFEQLGATAAASAKEVGDRAETVLVSLPTPPIVEEVTTGPGGIAEGSAVRCIVDLSTTGSTVSTRIAAALAESGIRHLDSPVSGGVGGAEKGTLAVMVSGPLGEFERLKPALSVIGKVFYVGEKAGLAQTMKLVNNLLSATALAASSEAMVMGVKAGLDPAIMLDVINSGSGINSATRDKFPKSILPGTFDYGFATELMYKDVRLCLSEAEVLEVPMPVASAVRQQWQLSQLRIGGAKDFTTIVQLIEEWAGVEVRARRPGA